MVDPMLTDFNFVDFANNIDNAVFAVVDHHTVSHTSVFLLAKADWCIRTIDVFLRI